MSELYINSIAKGTTTVSEFGGLNLKPSCGFNEFSYMKNMTSDNYPLLSTRNVRKNKTPFTIPFSYYEVRIKNYISHPYGFSFLLNKMENGEYTKVERFADYSNLYMIIAQDSQPDRFFKYDAIVSEGGSGTVTLSAKFEHNDPELIEQAKKDLHIASSGNGTLSDENILTIRIFGMPQSNVIILDSYIYYIRQNSLYRKSTKALSKEEMLIENEFSGNQQIQIAGRSIVIMPSMTVYNIDSKMIYGKNHSIPIYYDDVKIECPETNVPSYRFVIKTPYKNAVEGIFPLFVFNTQEKIYKLDICDGQDDDYNFVSETYNQVLNLQEEKNKEVKDFIDNHVITHSAEGRKFTAKLKSSSFDKYEPIGQLVGFAPDSEIRFKFALPYNNRLFACNTKGDCTYSSVIGRLYDFATLEDGEASADWIEVNSNGNFTAMTAFGGNVYYFKENCVHKLYGSSPSDWQLVMLPINGVENGAHGSLAVENDICIYKSTDGFYYFDGSSSVKISDNLGVWAAQGKSSGEKIPLTNVEYSACIFKGKYYCIAYDCKNNLSTLYTYDIQRGIWCCEESCDSVNYGGKIILELVKTSRDVYGAFLTYGGDYHADYKDIRFIPLCGGNEFYKDGYTYESIFDWSVISGRLTLSTPNIKEINKIQIRAEGSEWTSVKATLIADENGNEIASFEFKPRKLNTFQFPLKPLRCDNVKLKLEGQGFCIIHSITLSVSERTEYR